MGEKRLIEIATAIVKVEDVMDVMEYVSNLSPSEVYLLLRYISSSKYEGMSFLSALLIFAKDYLDSKNVKLDVETVE